MLCILTFQGSLTEERISVAFPMAYPRPIRVIVCPASPVSGFYFLYHILRHVEGAFGSQASGINPGEKDSGNIGKEYFGAQKIHQCTHVGGSVVAESAQLT